MLKQQADQETSHTNVGAVASAFSCSIRSRVGENIEDSLASSSAKRRESAPWRCLAAANLGRYEGEVLRGNDLVRVNVLQRIEPKSSKSVVE